jgi:hypothetical protein
MRSYYRLGDPMMDLGLQFGSTSVGTIALIVIKLA